MVRPVAFHSNPQTAASNAFQSGPEFAEPEIAQAAAAAEFDGLAGALRAAGVETVVVGDTSTPATPDAVFPNNWVSFHADGTAVLYPMMAANRRGERRRDILELLSREHGFRIENVVDLSPHERAGHFLESTGSMVLDRVNRVASACLSPRTHLDVLAEAAQLLDYEPLAFAATDPDGVPIYHTNVLMSIGEDFAVVCPDSIADEGQRRAVLARLEQTGHDLILLATEQITRFAGNMLELRSPDGARVLAMSRQALECLHERQRSALASRCRIVSAPIETIETGGGGSVRCMLAEIHLPRR
jgi:hypothetical protein